VALQVTFEPGEVAKLIQRYLDRRGASPHRLATKLGVSSKALYMLTAGWNDNGTRALGIMARTAETPLLHRVVDALAIPHDEVVAALASDLGFTPELARYLLWQKSGVRNAALRSSRAANFVRSNAA